MLPLTIPLSQVDSYALLTRPPLVSIFRKRPATVRLACVKHAASVQSEPGSNSSILNTQINKLKKIGIINLIEL
jgi:hypothetical protein